jgi:hypothetical protein
VEARQRIAGDKSDECRHGRGAARFELCKSLRILRHRRRREGIRRQTLTGTQRLAAATQDQIVQWPLLKVLRALGERGTDADPGPQNSLAASNHAAVLMVSPYAVSSKKRLPHLVQHHGIGLGSKADAAIIFPVRHLLPRFSLIPLLRRVEQYYCCRTAHIT